MAFVPKVCFGYTPDSYPNLRISFDRLWGKLTTNLPTTNGYGIFDWMDGRTMSTRYYTRGAAPVFGRETVTSVPAGIVSSFGWNAMSITCPW